ncbi:MAG: hypothetical protein M1826_001901 [Phylliscum demangeonii]|nr:MAG: hypothetical protein M1826_001901 [Phylliscum demangeonii]
MRSSTVEDSSPSDERPRLPALQIVLDVKGMERSTPPAPGLTKAAKSLHGQVSVLIDGGIRILGIPKFDLDTYIAGYVGRTRFDRLCLIGCRSAYLSVDALRAAVKEAKRGRDVGRYVVAVEALHTVAPQDRDGGRDEAWIAVIRRQVLLETERLELELKGYKNNLIKESIRKGNEDLGSHFYAAGDLTRAFRTFSRMREYCTSPKHLAEMSVKLILVAIEQRNWLSVQNNVNRIRQAGSKADEKTELHLQLNAAMGLAQMCSGKHRDAAESFLGADPGMVAHNVFGCVLTANDVAVYAALCALASLSRDQLQHRLLHNPAFRPFLELEPHVRQAVHDFCASKFAHCLATLEAYKVDYRLDVHLREQVDALFAGIRTKCIIQYCVPFSVVKLASMAAAFSMPEEALERELVAVIRSGKLDARLDAVNRLLTPLVRDPRDEAMAEVLAATKRYEQTLRLRLYHQNILAAGLEVPARAPRTRSAPLPAEYGGASAGADPDAAHDMDLDVDAGVDIYAGIADPAPGVSEREDEDGRAGVLG